MSLRYIAVLAAVLVVGGAAPALAQFQQGGVDHSGEWHVGEGMAAGDYYSYIMCHVDYRECAQFQMDIWIEGDIQVGTETKWLAHVVVYDGNRVTAGQMELGKIAPEPTGGTAELSTYRGAFKSSIVWLSAFANANEPKKFSLPSWGKIANIGGEQILPKELVEGGLDVRAGHFEEVILVGWRTGGATSNIWVVDGFPFPIKALTWTHVSEGIPPKEYDFELRDYRTGVSENPLAGIVSTAQEQAQLGCPEIGGLEKSIKKPTNSFKYQIHAFYTPDPPVEDCPMKWLVKFISKYDDTEFLNQVQYDVWVVDVNESGQPLTPPVRSIADDDGRLFLFSPSGQSEIEFTVAESETANYLIRVYGLAPENIVPSPGEGDFLLIPLQVHPGLDDGSDAAPGAQEPEPAPGDETGPAAIPDWIKNTARWWAEGQIDDDSFVQGLQFLIREGIIVVPPTEATEAGEPGSIPSWIKNNALWWADGLIDDNSFVQGIQFLISSGIIRVS